MSYDILIFIERFPNCSWSEPRNIIMEIWRHRVSQTIPKCLWPQVWQLLFQKFWVLCGFKKPEPLQLRYQLFPTPPSQLFIPTWSTYSPSPYWSSASPIGAASRLWCCTRTALSCRRTHAARELHLEALASVSEDERAMYSEDGDVTATGEEFILLTEEEARRFINGLNFQQRLRQLWKNLSAATERVG